MRLPWVALSPCAQARVLHGAAKRGFCSVRRCEVPPSSTVKTVHDHLPPIWELGLGLQTRQRTARWQGSNSRRCDGGKDSDHDVPGTRPAYARHTHGTRPAQAPHHVVHVARACARAAGIEQPLLPGHTPAPAHRDAPRMCRLGQRTAGLPASASSSSSQCKTLLRGKGMAQRHHAGLRARARSSA